MARRCGCGSTCACKVIAGDGAAVDGVGTEVDPYVISLDGEAVVAGVSSVNGATGVVDLDLDDMDDTVSKVSMTPAERSKLTGIATGATANQTDAYLLDRSHHSGTQPMSTLSDFLSVTSLASSATPTPIGSFRENDYFLTALAAPATFAAPTGTLVDGNKLMIRIRDNGVARALTWNAIFKSIVVALPTTTVAGKVTYVGARYNAPLTRWDVLAVVTEV